MRPPRLSLRSLLSAVAILAIGMGACRSIRDRLAYCRDRSLAYDTWAYSLERKAFWDARSTSSFGMGPGWAEVAATKLAAAERRARAAEFRAASWRLWRRLPSEPPARPGPILPPILLPCPDDDGVVVPRPAAIEIRSGDGA